MRRTTLTLSLALAVSIVMNVMLWRRAPQPSPPSVAPAAAPAISAPPEPIDASPELRKLKDQLAVAKASGEIQRKAIDLPGAAAPSENPDAREYDGLFDLVRAFIETRKAKGLNEDGDLITFQKEVLTPENRAGALRVLAEYLAPDDATRRWFCDRAEAAILQYHRAKEEDDRESAELNASLQRLNEEQRFEDIAALNGKFADRSKERFDQWDRDYIRSMQKVLDGRDGVRPALLSRHLGGLLWQLITPDER
jgi:hypothetical protein